MRDGTGPVRPGSYRKSIGNAAKTCGGIILSLSLLAAAASSPGESHSVKSSGGERDLALMPARTIEYSAEHDKAGLDFICREKEEGGKDVTAAAGVFTPAGSGTQARPPQERPLRHDAAAVVKLIPVRVLGKDGRPLKDLRKEDFVLYEDGRRKAITEFEIHSLTEAGMTVAPKLPPATEAAARRSGATNRKFFFFLDQQASDEMGKAKARTAALRFLDTQVRPGDQVAVLGFYTMSGVYIHEYLTTDMQRVRKAISKPNEPPASKGYMLIVADDTVDVGAGSEGINVWTAGGETPPETRIGFETSDVSPRSVTRVGVPGSGAFARVDFLPRMLDLAEVLKTIPGNKTLVLFTSRNLGAQAERLGKLFGAAGTAVFTVNTQDWKMSPMGKIGKVHYIWWDHSLKNLAAASGGKYFADINDTASFVQDVQDLTGYYYVLGYYVTESWEGKYHKIRVEVARPDANVIVQDGYYDPKPFAQMSDFEKDVQLIDLIWSEEPAANPLPLSIDPLVVEVKKTSRACLLSKWDVGAKTGVPASRVEIYALLRDEAGTPLISRKWNADLAPYSGRLLFPYLSVPVPDGACELRLVIRDRETGEAHIGRASFVVARALEEGIALGSPLLFEAGAEASFLRLSTKQDEAFKGKPDAEETSLLGLYPLIPKAAHAVVGEVTSGAHKIMMALPFEIRPWPASDEPILAVEAKLIPRAGGDAIPLEITVTEHRSYERRPDILLAEISLPGMTAGSYELEIAVEDMGTDRRAAVRKPLVIH
jgi:VWFA-related protein